MAWKHNGPGKWNSPGTVTNVLLVDGRHQHNVAITFVQEDSSSCHQGELLDNILRLICKSTLCLAVAKAGDII